MTLRSSHRLLCLLMFASASPAIARGGAAAPDDQSIQFFESKIRPVLAEHCYKCHSVQSKKLKGGLYADTRAGLLHGGETGPAVVPGKPAESLLIKAVMYQGDVQMPPKNRLPASAVADLKRWVEMGAPWPEQSASGTTTKTEAPAAAREPSTHWAFQPIRPQTPPAVRNAAWPANDVDRFILSKLEENHLPPAPPADPRTLIRRATFDLTGLPPTPSEVEAFVNDASPGAFERVVDRLLASPAYGERWGRHWLDLARYADTNGADENYAYPNAWRYRDYVVRSFNDDKPYDRFITEQLAGDLLPADPPAYDNLVATGFLVLGPKMLAEQDKPKLVMDIVDEQIDVVSQTFLGLTIGCARCHDHKFDPIPTSDYYALAGIFKSTKTMADLAFVSNINERELSDPPAQAAAEEHQKVLAAAKAERDALAKSAKSNDEKKRLAASKARAAELEKSKPNVPKAMAVADGKPQDVPVHIRGSHLAPAKQPTPRGFVRVLDPCVAPPTIAPSGSGRLELAKWLTDPANPLTARVMVNRIWQGHFGVGLVSTPSNFGLRGSPPSHPELLDWLAADFARTGWSVKHMHRRIVLSRTWQMSSRPATGAAPDLDPENRLLAHQNRRRLEAEPIRDALFAVAGNLDRSRGGTMSPPTKELYSRIKDDDPAFASNRRAIYLPIVRSRMYDLFTTFDYVDSGVHVPRRSVTVVPQQALLMMNNDLVVRQAGLLAQKVLASGGDDDAKVKAIYERLYARPPTALETAEALAYVSSAPPGAGDPRAASWASLCRVLLAANEFVYLN